MRPARTTLASVLVAAGAATLGTAAQPPAPQPPLSPTEIPRPKEAQDLAPPVAPGPAPVAPTRAELAARYIEADRLFMNLLAHEPAPAKERLESINREFDAISVLFFSGNFAVAIARLDEMAQGLAGPADSPIAPTIGTPISVRVEPPLWWPTSPATPRVRIRSFGQCLDRKSVV